MFGLLILGATFLAAFLLLRHSKLPAQISKTGARTPPGVYWRLPILGETLQFLKDPHRFYLDHISRYGEIFCTSFFGDKCIVVTTPEACKWVLQTAQKSFKPAYPESANSLIDPTRSFSNEHHHTFVRKVVGSCLYPESLQFHVAAIDRMACSLLDSWSTKDPINVYNEMAKYTFEVTMKILCGMEPGPQMDSLFQNMQDFEKAFLSLHINLPFTTYRRGLKARDALFKAVEEMIQRRKIQKHKMSMMNHNESRTDYHYPAAASHPRDMLESIVQSRPEDDEEQDEEHDEQTQKQNKSGNVTDIHVRGIMMTILFAGHETSAAQLVWAIKHLHQNPQLLQLVKAEHEAIQARREPGAPLTWSQVKEMHLTLRVINETMRTSYIGLFLPREPLDDLEYDGYYFPKGWKVYASPSMLHLNPKLYPDPYNFDPSRFQDGGPKPNTFMPFGNGNRFCLGSELAKVEMLILIHHLVTKYSWKIQGLEYGGGIRWWPVPIPKDGLVIRVDPCSQTQNNDL